MGGEGGLCQTRTTLPTAHQLRSALRCGRLIDTAGVTVDLLRRSYRLVPYGGLYRSEDLIEAETLLIKAGLVFADGDLLIPMKGLNEIAQASDADGCEALLAALLHEEIPLWLLAATSGGVLADELIPDEEGHKLSSVLGPERREALLLEIGRRFSDEAQAVTGAVAERFVVACCKAELRDVGESELAERVRRVSETSDQLGYDVTAPRRDHSTRRIEVKGTRAGGTNLVFYLSRNEAERSLADPDWSLVGCRIARDDHAKLVGHLFGTQLKAYLPHDPRSEARWQSVRLDVPDADFASGLPPIE
jgi:hypothetical protein